MTQNTESSTSEGTGSGIARHGKLSYLQIPAASPESSAAFYERVFGWQIGGNPAHVSFSDTSGELIGAFVKGLAASGEPGFIPYVYVDGVDATLASIEASGGSIEKEPYPEGELWVATFRDPAGNVMGIWQAGGR